MIIKKRQFEFISRFKPNIKFKLYDNFGHNTTYKCTGNPRLYNYCNRRRLIVNVSYEQSYNKSISLVDSICIYPFYESLFKVKFI